MEGHVFGESAVPPASDVPIDTLANARPPGGRVCYLTDPDGTVIELQAVADEFGTVAE